MLRISALERSDDSGNLLKEKLSKLSKLRWPLAWPMVCRNPIDVDVNFTVDRGTALSVGALYWQRNGLLGFKNLNDSSSTDAENKCNVLD